MKKSIAVAVFSLAISAPIAGAYEYPLQFTPNPGYRALVVAGYQFEGTDVVGNCSYYTVSGSSGKGGGGRSPISHIYDQTCRWDLFGNLLSVTPGVLVPPIPVSIQGAKVVFAINASGDSTGFDAALPGGGYVNTPGSHYTWLTPQNSGVVQQMAYSVVATLRSDGDVGLNITNVTPSALLGKATLKSTTCVGAVNVGSTCSITVTYDTTGVTDPTGLAYDTLRIDLTSNAGDAHDFVQNFTVVLPNKQ
jgi:hypothetical protein